MEEKSSHLAEPRPGFIERYVGGVARDPLALTAMGLVVAELFTRITFDLMMSVALIGLIMVLAARRAK